MTDRELLELAAKAAGYERNSAGPIGPCEWNPLEDDGDALRLAVRLHLKILIGEAWSVAGEHQTMFRVSQDDEPCQYAATRRAIVRAAAEIGKEMK